MDSLSFYCLLLLLLLNKLADSGFVDRDRVKYFNQSRLRALKTAKKSLELDCNGLAINLLSVQVTCNGKVISLTSHFLDECESKPFCTLDLGCYDGISNSTVHYTCRGLDELDINDKKINSAFFRDNSLASLRCGLNRFVFISSAFYIHHFSDVNAGNDGITDEVKKECDYGEACSFIPKLLPGLNKAYKDSYVYITFSYKFACSTLYCEENSTCVVKGRLPPVCVCNDGYVMKNGHCVKNLSVKPIPINQRPSWELWRGGIPDALGKLNTLASNENKLKLPHSKSGFSENQVNRTNVQLSNRVNTGSKTESESETQSNQNEQEAESNKKESETSESEQEQESQNEGGSEKEPESESETSGNEQGDAVESDSAAVPSDELVDNLDKGSRNAPNHLQGNQTMKPDLIIKACFLNADRIVVFEISCNNRSCEYRYKECYNISN
uniref:EGF-like domain-containing protein n=1 Tax=Theileria annulata TaxID=5874 RepID=A0A3B0MQ52_THEAN